MIGQDLRHYTVYKGSPAPEASQTGINLCCCVSERTGKLSQKAKHPYHQFILILRKEINKKRRCLKVNPARISTSRAKQELIVRSTWNSTPAIVTNQW